jgi:hypothetical protein
MHTMVLQPKYLQMSLPQLNEQYAISPSLAAALQASWHRASVSSKTTTPPPDLSILMKPELALFWDHRNQQLVQRA